MPALTDRYGLPLSTSSPAARDAYVAGVDCVLGAMPGWREPLERALQADPSFAMAHIALARGLFLVADVKPAREAAAKARALGATGTTRESDHIHCLALAIEGKPVEAFEASRRHLAEFPRDALALAPLTGVFGLIGFSGRQDREEELYALLARLAPHYGGDWWFGCVQAFAACESGRLDEASDLIEASMQANGCNAHGAHVMAHVLHEKREAAKVVAFLDAWLPGYDRSGLMHCHLSWHAALSALELGETERAWSAYRKGVHPGAAWGPPLNLVTDSASFLWRAELAGERRRADAWREVRDAAHALFPSAAVPFADVHVALARIASGDDAGVERLAGELKARLDAGRLPPGRVAVLLVEGFAAYARKQWDAAVRLLEQALPEAVRIGGSRAQRELVELTLAVARAKAAGR